MKSKDLTGMRFGKLTVISRGENKLSGGQQKVTWKCVCDCGETITVWASSLTKGKAVSCGCGKRLQLVGKRFGKLLVVSPYGTKNGASMWLCKCDCGNTAIKKGAALKAGVGCHCGCVKNEMLRKRFQTHNLSRTRLYKIWNGMKNRCSNTNLREYKYYGGRGIKVCNEWKEDFMKFYDWAIANDYADELTIDRIDVDGDYSPSNCRWITNREQQFNKRNNVLLTHNGETKTLTEWCEEKHLAYQTLRGRIYRLGWSIDKAIETPVDTRFGYRGRRKMNG